MKIYLLLLVLSTLSIALPAQDSSSTQHHSLYLASPVFLDIPYKYEPFFGIALNYDFRIHTYLTWVQMGISASVGQIGGSYSRYNAGPFFKIGPKFFLGSSRKCLTIGLQYFNFREKGGIDFHGSVMGVGIALMRKRGFLFHPKIEYQYSSSKEKTKYPNPALRNFAIEVGLGYSF